ncbi:hypothetical protein ABZP36_034288 [Zizania latifolia]
MAAAAAAVPAVPASSCDNACLVDRPKKMNRRRSPPEEEVEVFFAAAESTAARRFAAKYNYDVVNDAPMDGRYEWVRVHGEIMGCMEKLRAELDPAMKLEKRDRA